MKYEIVYEVAIKLSSSDHEIVRDVVDEELTDTPSPASERVSTRVVKNFPF